MNNNFEKMTPIPPLFFNPNAPSLYGLGLTDYEILTKIAYKINECVLKINSFSELYEKIENDLKQLDENISNEVVEQLKKMLENGELKKVIDDFLENQLLAKTDTLTTVRKWRKINATGVNDFFNSDELYSVNQGATVFKNNDGNLRFAVYFGKKTRQSTGVENGRLAIFKPTSTIPLDFKDIPCGHGQSIAEIDGFFYIAHSTENVSTLSTKISKINVETLEYSTLDDVSFTNRNPYQVFEVGKILYFIDGKNNGVYKVTDFSKGKCSFLYSILPNSNGTNGAVNGACVKNGFLFVVDSENLQVYNFETGNLIWTYNLKNITSDGYNLGEIQAISNYNEKLAVFSWVSLGGTSGIAQRSLTQLFLIDPIKNNLITYLSNIEKSGTNHATLYVAGDSTTSFEEPTTHQTVNPDGTADKPFNTIQEALDFFANTHAKSVEIRLTGSDKTYSIWSGVNGFLRNYNAGYSLICGGLYVENGGSCRMQGASTTERLTFAQSNTSAVGSFAAGIAPCYALGGTLQFVKNLYFNPASNNYNKCQYAVNLNQSVLLSSNPTSQDITAYNGSIGKVNIANSLSNRSEDDF